MPLDRSKIEELLTVGYTHIELDADWLEHVANLYGAWGHVFSGVSKHALAGDGRIPWGYVPIQSESGWAMKESYYCRLNDWVPPMTREVTRRLFTMIVEFSDELRRSVNAASGMSLIDGSDACLRVMRYPGWSGDRESRIVRELAAGGMLRANAHIDLNVVTALTPPSAPGLQVKHGETWETIDEDPSMMILQTGAQMSERSEGRYQGCVHRVRNPTQGEPSGSRMAAAFFIS